MMTLAGLCILVIVSNDNKTPTHVLHEQLNFLKLDDNAKLELAKIMYLLHHNNLPRILLDCFTKIKIIHSHNTRQLLNIVYFLPCVNKYFAQNLLSFRGTKL